MKPKPKQWPQFNPLTWKPKTISRSRPWTILPSEGRYREISLGKTTTPIS